LQIAALLPPGEGCGPGLEDNIYNLPNGEVAFGTRPFSVTSGRGLPDSLDFQSNNWEATIVSSTYNALQASLEK